MRQLIARIDDDLHARLKERAAAEHRSVNSLVTELLENGVSKTEARRRWRARLEAEGRVFVPPQPKGPVLSHDELAEVTRGWGTAVSDALQAMRDESY
ncbi:MAG: FitA-like ribbon-helix-helix domain-containing protein [Gaiellaceae bacterium]